jgi:hypothetical protein
MPCSSAVGRRRFAIVIWFVYDWDDVEKRKKETMKGNSFGFIG